MLIFDTVQAIPPLDLVYKICFEIGHSKNRAHTNFFKKQTQLKTIPSEKISGINKNRYGKNGFSIVGSLPIWQLWQISPPTFLVCIMCREVIYVVLDKDFWFLGRGVPRELTERNYTATILEADVPPENEASLLYDRVYNRKLTDPYTFAPDPFPSDANRVQCDLEFSQHVPDLSVLLDAAVNRNYTPFQEALCQLIQITHRWSCR